MARQFKPFTAEDLFKGLTILGKLDLKEIADCFRAPEVKDSIEDGKMAEEVGIAVGLQMLDLLIDNLNAVKEDLLNLIASKIADEAMTGDDLADMPADEFMELLVDFFTSEYAADFGEAVLRQRARIQQRLSKGSTAATPIR